MKIKFSNIDQIESFLDITQQMEADVLIQEGNLQLDGKSSIGMLKIPLNYPVSVYVIEKKNISEVSDFIKRCMAINVVV